MKDVILFGMQGSGKGTQAAILAEKYGYQIFETGAELRKIMKEEGELGDTVRAIIERGDLVPNDIVMDIVSHFLDQVAPGEQVLFDGLPRSMPQKETFDALLSQHGRSFVGVFISLKREEAITRMLSRGRADDTKEVIERRLENFDAETRPVIDAYIAEGVMQEVNGMQSIDEVQADIVKCLE